MGRNRSLELSPRARLVDDVEVEALRRKREAMQWRPSNGFLLDETQPHASTEEPTERAA
jgi:hypothetical protein